MEALLFSWLTEESLKAGDLASVNRLLRQLSPQRRHRLTQRELLVVLHWPAARTCVARNARGTIVGMALVNLWPNLSYGLHCWIDDVVVDESLRGKGIAHELMRRIEAFAEAEGALTSALTTHRPNAQRLYERLGYATNPTTLMVKWLNWSERFRKKT